MIANHSLYKGTFPELMYSMTCYYVKIASLAEIYIWSSNILELAIAYMNDITTNVRGLSTETWSAIPQEWIDMYCGPMKILSRKQFQLRYHPHPYPPRRPRQSTITSTLYSAVLEPAVTASTSVPTAMASTRDRSAP
jgi:hypothetical protein